MKFLFLAAIFSLAACSGDENNSNNGTTNNGETNGSNNGTSNNGTTGGTSNNGSTGGTTTSTTGTTGVIGLTFAASATDFASTQLFTVAVGFGEEQAAASVNTDTLSSGDIGLATGENYYFVLDRGAFGVHEGSIRIFDREGILDGWVDLSGNVKDAVDVGDKVFITSYGDGEVQVLKKTGTEWALSTPIDLNAFNVGGDADDTDPEVDAIIANGDELIVVLQTLNGFDSIEKSRVVIIDATTEQVVDQVAGGEVDALELLNRNAFSGLVKVAENKFAVGSIGDFGDASADAGIEIITKGNDGLYTTEAYMTEEDFGLDLFSVIFTGEDSGFALVGFDTTLVAFENGATLAELPGDLSVDSPTAMSIVDDYLVVSYVNADGSGFHVYELSTGKLLLDIPVTLSAMSTISNVEITAIY